MSIYQLRPPMPKAQQPVYFFPKLAYVVAMACVLARLKIREYLFAQHDDAGARAFRNSVLGFGCCFRPRRKNVKEISENGHWTQLAVTLGGWITSMPEKPDLSKVRMAVGQCAFMAATSRASCTGFPRT
jgi:hypothetical protein